MVLGEIVGRLGPEGAVVQGVALRPVVAVGILGELPGNVIEDQPFIKGVETSQAVGIHIGVGKDAVVQERLVVIAGDDAVPRLSSVLVIAYIAVSYDKSIAYPRKASQPASAVARRAVDVTVGAGLVVGAFYYKMVAYKPRGETAAHVEGVVAAVGAGDFGRWKQRRSLGGEGHGAAESAVTVGRGAHSPLDLGAAQKGAVAVHIGPEHALVFRRIERHAVKRDVYAGIAGSADTHIGSTGAQAVFAPGENAGSACEKQRELPARRREVFEFGAAHTGNRKRCIFLRTDGAYHRLGKLFNKNGILLAVEGGRNQEHQRKNKTSHIIKLRGVPSASLRRY